MSDLRDARLRRALESAPDAHMRPDAKTWAAIRSAAVGAPAQAALPAPWWRRASERSGDRGPWSAAFASVLLAGFVALMWHGREVPDARPDPSKVAMAPLPQPAPVAPAAAPEPAPASARAPSPAPAPVRREQAPKPAPRAAATAAPQRPAAGAEAVAERAAPQLADSERRELAKAASPPPPAEAPATVAAEPTVVAQAPMPPAPTSPGAPPAMHAPSPAPAPAAAAARAPDSGAGFAQRSRALPQSEQNAVVRLTTPGRVVEVPPSQSRRLVELVQSVARAAQGSEPLAAPVTLRVELAAGVLEIAGPQVRWQGLTGRPDAAVLQTLEQDAARLLAR